MEIYAIFTLRFNQKQFSLLWLDKNDQVSFWQNEFGVIQKFASAEELLTSLTFLQENKILPEESVYDLDFLQEIVANPDNLNYEKCREIAFAWNFFIDLASSLHIKYSGDLVNQQANTLFEKISEIADFLDMDDTENTLKLKPQEVQLLQKVVQEGVQLVQKID